MADRTNISWTDATWNVVTGCSKISTGCANCYAAAMAPRLARMGAKGYTELPWTEANSDQNVTLHPDRLDQPLRTKKAGKKFFTCSMSDLFHEQISDDFLDKVFAVMALANQHTFQVLTKRPRRMAQYIQRVQTIYPSPWSLVGNVSQQLLGQHAHEITAACERGLPLPNVWLGTSAEDQRAADERIPHLLDAPAAVRFVSCEPLVGRVDLRAVRCGDSAITQPGVDSDPGQPMGTFDALRHPDGIDWVIAGGESGPEYREMDEQWAGQLRDDCRLTGTAFFFKQKAGYRPESDVHLDGEIIRQFPDHPADGIPP